MIDRAGPFLARRSLTALVVSAFVISALAGMFIIGDKTSASGDLIVSDGTYVIQNLHQYVDGNVEVLTGATLKIVDGTLSVISNFDQKFTVTVDGGTLMLDHGVLTTHLDQINPWAELEVIVTNGGSIIATNGSELRFPGGITLSDDSTVVLRDSAITALDGETVALYVVGSSGLITLDSANDGPAIDITDSTMQLYDSTIDSMPEYPADGMPAGNFTMNGESTLLSVNSHISVDFGPALDAVDWYVHNVLVVNDLSKAYLYGTTFDEYEGPLADRAPAVVVSGVTTSPAIPTLPLGGGDTTVGEDIDALAAVDSQVYEVNPGETMEIGNWDVGGLLDATPVSSASIVVTYSVNPSYTDPDETYIDWRPDAGGYIETTIRPLATDPPGTTATYDLPIATISDVGDLRTMDVRFVNNAPAGSVQFECLWVVFSAGGEAYAYRWLNATVGDEYGVPIPNATVSAVFTGATDLEGQEAFYYTVDGISLDPDPDVLDYMGEDVTEYKTTKANGRAVIPYLTDIIVSDGSANSLFVGSYAFTGTAVIESVEYISTESYSFSAYPAMDAGDQSSDLTVEIMGVSVSSPDDSRWLVVPLESGEETFTIEDMTFYHAGDVIVASDGVLIVRNVEFLLVQDFPNQRTIYVDGYGHLVFENSYIESELPIDIVVQGHGTLEVIDSEMHGVSVVAKEDAVVILDGTDAYEGDITTSYNSRAHISIYDCNLTNSPVLSGFAVGGFTNTSVPSVIVEDDAIAYIYRWIHVYLLDGNVKPLPGVDVFAYRLISQEYWTSAVSDSTGVARLNCLGTTLTSTGPSYAGSYSVNATYWYDGTPYESDQEVNVGVMPYTEPLGRNATYATLTISEALPDLTIAQTGAISSDPLNPLNGQETIITAMVQNIGISVAYNVQVDFFDNNIQFASVVVPSIAPDPVDATAVLATWIADEPLYPEPHSIKVEVDPDDLVNEFDDSDAISTRTIYVQNLPDLVASPEYAMYTDPPEPVLDSQCELVARIYNTGDNSAYNVPVAFYNATIDLVGPANFIGEYVISSVSPGNYVDARVVWTPENLYSQTITVLVNEDHTVPEISYANNNASFEVTVYNYPDLALSDFEFEGPATVASGQTVTVRATLENLEAAPVTDPVVGLFLNGEKWSEGFIDGTFMSSSGTGLIEFEFIAPFVTATTEYVVTLSANPDRLFQELSWLNNNVSGVMTVSDIRPDLQVTSAGIWVTYDGANVTEQMWGRTVEINIEVENLGATSVSEVTLEWGIQHTSSGINYTHETSVSEVAAGEMIVVPIEWRINLTTSGSYVIWAFIDPWDAETLDEVNESDEANNFADTAFVVAELAATVTVETLQSDYEAGSSVITTVTVLYEDDGTAVVGLPVTLSLCDSSDAPVPGTNIEFSTNSNGKIEGVSIGIPQDVQTGQYYVGVDIMGDVHTSPLFTVTGEGGGEGIPLLIWLIVIAIIIAVVVGFTAYTYVYGLGKLVECGECGAFIPAASKRCPKCGVEFEAGTMKCSECGAWVPSSASECPNCGVKFVGEPGEGELDYLDKMRSEYEAMVSEYREMAKAQLGKKFSDKRFEDWWRTQPTYVSFDDWLAKEEAKRKEGPVPCQVCGTLNPREATVCHKCGTIFAREGGEPPNGMPPEEPPYVEEPMPKERAPPSQRRPPEGGAGAAAAPRTVVRRPIDRKVVPKKIIRTPAETDEESR